MSLQSTTNDTLIVVPLANFLLGGAQPKGMTKAILKFFVCLSPGTTTDVYSMYQGPIKREIEQYFEHGRLNIKNYSLKQGIGMIKRWLVGAKRILKNIGKSDIGII